MEEHKRWADYTEKEILEIQKKKCRHCKYSYWLAMPHMPYKTGRNNRMRACDYLGKTGEMRPTSPAECQIYKEQGSQKKQAP
jgi:hypothetical protein